MNANFRVGKYDRVDSRYLRLMRFGAKIFKLSHEDYFSEKFVRDRWSSVVNENKRALINAINSLEETHSLILGMEENKSSRKRIKKMVEIINRTNRVLLSIYNAPYKKATEVPNLEDINFQL